MSSERIVSARRVEVKPSATTASSSSSSASTSAPPAPRTLHERFSQLPPKPEAPKAERASELNQFHEVGVNARRQATEQRQGAQRSATVAARRAIATPTWTPSFDDTDTDGHHAQVSINLGSFSDYDDSSSSSTNVGRAKSTQRQAAPASSLGPISSTSTSSRRQFEFDQPRETAFVIKGIPVAQPVKARTFVGAQQQQQHPQRGSARIVHPIPATRGGMRGGRGAARGQPVPVGRLPRSTAGSSSRGRSANVVAAINQRGAASSRGGARGGASARGGARGGASVRGGGGGGASSGRPSAPLSKDALDAELDNYMLKDNESAKSYLDQQLDDYMHSREQDASASS